jgi:hypothetical protein
MRSGGLPLSRLVHLASGSMHRWFPAVVTRSPISVSKRPSSCKNLVGAVGFEPTNPSLVRRNSPQKGPAHRAGFMRSTCENHALRCPGMPGKVCTVVPASGSRSNVRDHHSPAWSKGSRLLCLSPALPAARPEATGSHRCKAINAEARPGLPQRHQLNSNRHGE